MEFHKFENINPESINGVQLKTELGCDEVYFRDGILFIGGTLTEKEAAAGLAAHVPALPKEPTVLEKLDSIGVTIPDLKIALGL